MIVRSTSDIDTKQLEHLVVAMMKLERAYCGEDSMPVCDILTQPGILIEKERSFISKSNMYYLCFCYSYNLPLLDFGSVL